MDQLPGVAPAFVRKIHRALPGNGWVKDLWFACSRGRNLGWKHGCVPVGAASRHAVVIVTKNPYAWLLSLHRRPYQPTPELDFETFLTQPWQTVGRDNLGSVAVNNPVELWNAKGRSYLGAGGAVVTAYERVLQDPKAFVDLLANAFGFPRKAAYFTNLHGSTKDVGRDFAWYQDHYLNERWRDRLSPRAVTAINARLDHGLAARLGYQSIRDQ